MGITIVPSGEIDFSLETEAWVASNVDAGEPIVALADVRRQAGARRPNAGRWRVH